MKVRIGIDVGGTFTDAVAIDNDTYEIIGTVKTPTTHTAEAGVAAGIVQVLHGVMEQHNIKPEDVVFIAHGTTQATNALLEGDVAQVGIVTLGSGLQGAKSKSDTNVGDIELAAGKFLRTKNAFVDTSSDVEAGIKSAIEQLFSDGLTSYVAAEAFSVDDPTNENAVIAECSDRELPATATNDISKLYGLAIRTRTAVVNASIMPKMLEAANMTDKSIREAGIESPLMVMRCDGGVMTVDEVRHRPILTILSGPAAGVAGALMYEKLTDGLFFEVGGTSTDISCVKDGKVMVKYAEVGGHKTYLSSLDVRTVGIGGGSMVQISDGKAVDVGPRSAHIANLDYEVYTDAEKIVNPRLVAVRPMDGDPEYAAIECDGGLRVCLTMAGAANLAGFVPEGDYAYGSVEAARAAWAPLAENMGMSVEDAAAQVLAFAAKKNGAVAEQLMKDYGMDPRTTVYVGGGGGASTVVPHLAKTMGHTFRIAKNAPVISTIGVALAMVRDMVERSVTNPTDDDIVSVRREAEARAIKMGAAPGTVEVTVEVDTQRHVVRAIAVGATELRSKDVNATRLSADELKKLVVENLGEGADNVSEVAHSSELFAYTATTTEKKLFGLLTKKRTALRLIDSEGVIRLQRPNADVLQETISSWRKGVTALVEDLTVYNDGGANLPNVYVVVGKRIIDLSGMTSLEQILSLAAVELGGYPSDEPVIIAATLRLGD